MRTKQKSISAFAEMLFILFGYQRINVIAGTIPISVYQVVSLEEAGPLYLTCAALVIVEGERSHHPEAPLVSTFNPCAFA